MEGQGQLWQDGVLIGHGEVITQTGLGFTRSAIGVAEGEWYRIISGGFLHAGMLHLGMNMLLLYLLGAQLEPLLGRVRFFTLYLACLVAGSFGVLLVQPTSVTVGASGAIFGLIGAALAAQRSAPHRVALANIGALIVINLLITFAVPNISVGAHVGGCSSPAAGRCHGRSGSTPGALGPAGWSACAAWRSLPCSSRVASGPLRAGPIRIL